MRNYLNMGLLAQNLGLYIQNVSDTDQAQMAGIFVQLKELYKKAVLLAYDYGINLIPDKLSRRGESLIDSALTNYYSLLVSGMPADAFLNRMIGQEVMRWPQDEFLYDLEVLKKLSSLENKEKQSQVSKRDEYLARFGRLFGLLLRLDRAEISFDEVDYESFSFDDLDFVQDEIFQIPSSEVGGYTDDPTDEDYWRDAGIMALDNYQPEISSKFSFLVPGVRQEESYF